MSFMSESAGHELQPGETLGPYRLDELLGEGGMGLVFKATRESDGAVVALKVMRFELIEDPVFGRRFEQEARAAAEVTEEHLVPVLEFGQADGRRFVASKYIDGKTLDEMLDEGPLQLADTAKYTQHVAAGLQALHDAGIVHRDLKPSNIIIDSTGEARLTDFGLAKGRAYTVLTKPGQVMGTLDYLAPELVKGEQATPATDIYALGCTVYECVAGQPPFGDKEGIQVGLAHVAEPPPALSEFRDDLSPDVEAAVLSALQKDPAARPQTAVEYGDRLAQTAG
jgi:serine/threonine-protein kinase